MARKLTAAEMKDRVALTLAEQVRPCTATRIDVQAGRVTRQRAVRRGHLATDPEYSDCLRLTADGEDYLAVLREHGPYRRKDSPMLTPAEVTRGLHRLLPGVDITTAASAEHRGAVVVRMPGMTASYGDRRAIAFLLRAATGVAAEVVDVQEMRPYITRGRRYMVTARFAA